MTTKIISNGSHYAGESLDSINKLLDRMKNYALDRSFEAFGNFIIKAPKKYYEVRSAGVRYYVEKEEYLYTEDTVIFFGNFMAYSHVFNIVTTDKKLIKRLTNAIKKNQARADYQSQEKPSHTPTETITETEYLKRQEAA